MSDLSEIEILQKAQELIRDPEHWTQGAYARTAKDREVGFLEQPACKFCSIGAVAKVIGDKSYDDYGNSDLWLRVSRAASWLDVAAQEAAFSIAKKLNDNGTHEDVMAMFDRAIVAARVEQERA